MSAYSCGRTGIKNTLQVLILGLFYSLVVSSLVVKAQSPNPPPLVQLDDPSRSIQSITWEPVTENRLAIAADSSIGIYSDDLQEITRLEGHSDIVFKMAWSPNGQMLASASADQTIRVWDVQDGSPTLGQTIKVLQGYTDWVTDVSWSPSGDKLASVAVERTLVNNGGQIIFGVQIWDVSNLATAQVVLTLPSYANVASLTWSPDGTYLSFGGDDGTGINYNAMVWNINNGDLQTTLPSFGTSRVIAVRWNPIANIVAVAPDLQVIYLYDPLTGQLLATLGGHTENIRSLTWSPDGNHLASASLDDTIRIWDVATAQTLSTIQDTSDVFQVYWNSDGSRLASLNAENIVRIWDVSDLPSSAGTPTVTPYPSLTPSSTPNLPTPTPTPVSISKIAFVQNVSDGFGSRDQIFTMNLDGW